MRVEPFERLRYYVHSRTGKEPYVVDIGSYRHGGKCNGRCNCEDFQIHHKLTMEELIFAERNKVVGEFEIQVGFSHVWFGTKNTAFKFVPSDRTRCAHIIAARDFAFDEMLDKLVTEVRKRFDDYKGDEEFE